MSSNPNTESFEDQLNGISDEYGQLHEEQCDLNSEDGSDDGCTCAMSGLVSEVLAAHQATTDQRVAEVVQEARIDELRTVYKQRDDGVEAQIKGGQAWRAYVVNRLAQLRKDQS